ncbi:MAG: hypothetical protein OHK0041_23550 [Anaerolineales bacterium]
MKTPPTSPRVQRKRQAAAQNILETARAIMREEGVAALSMQELARRMGMRAPSLYNYFASKLDIYDALFRLGFTLYDQRLQEQLQSAASPQDEIRIAIECYFSFALENPELYQLCFERPVPGFVPSQESLDLSFGVLNQAYARAAQHTAQLRPEHTPQQFVDMVIAVAHGLTAMHLANQPHLPVGQGRFGSLIPAAASMLEAALLKKDEG